MGGVKDTETDRETGEEEGSATVSEIFTLQILDDIFKE